MQVGRIGSLLFVGVVSALVLTGACGGENEKSKPSGSSGSAGTSTSGGSAGASSGGSGGTGGSAGSSGGALTCGTATCEPVSILGLGAIPACCPANMDNACGLDATILGSFLMFDDPCQPLDQPGTPDPECPSTDEIEVPDAGISTSFGGCCRPNGRCGYFADTVQLGPLPIALGLGCVDSTPFLDGGTPPPCGEGGEGGAGGQGGAAGAPGAGGAAGEGGEAGASEGGAAGDVSTAGMGGN